MSRTNLSPALILATWFGCGLFPKGPGTAGSLGALAVAWLVTGPLSLPTAALAAAVALLLLPSVWAANRACDYWKTKDPQGVVVDEVLGQWLTLAATPRLDWHPWLTAFLLFRFFDIVKPLGVRAAERLPRGWGIIADDLVAGLYAAVVLIAARWLHYL
jgi:phosphatidylglycerophosphatase A